MREQDRKFFEPLWRRVAVIVLLLAWTAWEWSNGESLWGTIVGGLTAYFIWTYLITFPAEPAPDRGRENPEGRREE